MSILDKILADKRDEIEISSKKLPLAELKNRIDDSSPRIEKRFSRALCASREISLIAEIKKASPSKGLIRQDFDPVSLAKAYEEGGAEALSVLTDKKYFQGASDYLIQVLNSCSLPVLRKEFIISEYQVYESRLMGADCILLIVAALEKNFLADLIALANDLAMDALVEVHDENELECAADSKANLIGVNNRNLDTFEVSLEVSKKLAPLFPESSIKVSESGISSYENIKMLHNLGFDAVLVGERLMRQEDVSQAVKILMQGKD